MSWVTFVCIQTSFIVGISLFCILVSRATGPRSEEGAEAAPAAAPDAEVAALPRFFCKEAPDPARRQPSAADLVVERLEDYLRIESARAQEFVSEPSVAKLYRNSERFQFN